MFVVFAFFILQAMGTFLIKDLIVNEVAYGVFLLLTAIIAVSIYLFRNLEKELLLIVYIGFALRIIILLVDLYVPAIEVFSSGDDSEYFHTASVSIAEGLLPVSEGRTAYVPFLAAIYAVIGDQRPFAQFMNIAFWAFSAVYLIKTLYYLKIDRKIILFSMLIFTFMPNSIFMSSILLRESIIILCITLSLYCFVRWFFEQNFWQFGTATALALSAMIFHSGMIGFVIAYLVAFVFLNQQKNAKEKSSFSRILYLVFFASLFIFILQNNELFLEKFSVLEEEGIENLELSGRGGSMYLAGLNGMSGWIVYLLAPLKMFYFLFSPLPADWRGLGDMASFFADASFYMLLLGITIYGLVKSELSLRNKIIIAAFLFITVLIYSYGTQNAGTAMRHRNKLMPLFLISYGIMQNQLLRKSAAQKIKFLKIAKGEK